MQLQEEFTYLGNLYFIFQLQTHTKKSKIFIHIVLLKNEPFQSKGKAEMRALKYKWLRLLSINSSQENGEQWNAQFPRPFNSTEN